MPKAKTEAIPEEFQLDLPKPQLNIKLRPADIHDILPITLMWAKMIEEVSDKFIELDKTELDKFSFALADSLRITDVFINVAEEKRKSIGFIYGYKQYKPYGKPNNIAFGECLYVDPKYRGKGINTELLNSLFKWAKERDLVVDMITKFDTDLAKVWERSGFKPYSILYRRS